jgi:hypothetical protein
MLSEGLNNIMLLRNSADNEIDDCQLKQSILIRALFCYEKGLRTKNIALIINIANIVSIILFCFLSFSKNNAFNSSSMTDILLLISNRLFCMSDITLLNLN